MMISIQPMPYLQFLSMSNSATPMQAVKTVKHTLMHYMQN